MTSRRSPTQKSRCRICGTPRSAASSTFEAEDVAVLLLPAPDGPCPRIELRHLDFIPLATVLVRSDPTETPVEREAAVIRCRCNDGALRLAFTTIAATLCKFLEDGTLDLSAQMPALERLFVALQRSARRSVVGLWGELVVLLEASDIGAAVVAWHEDPEETYDFRIPGAALEVKTSRQATRRHWISFGQAKASAHATCFIASLVAAPVKGGTTVADLIADAQGRLSGSPDLQAKVLTVASETLGEDFGRASIDQFDLEAARISLQYVRFDDLPRATFDTEVLDAKWLVGLQGIPTTALIAGLEQVFPG